MAQTAIVEINLIGPSGSGSGSTVKTAIESVVLTNSGSVVLQTAIASVALVQPPAVGQVAIVKAALQGPLSVPRSVYYGSPGGVWVPMNAYLPTPGGWVLITI